MNLSKKLSGIAFSLVFVLVICASGTHAMGILGDCRITVVYEPSLEKTFEYVIVPDAGGAQVFQLRPEGELAKYVTIAPKQIDLKSATGKFSVTVSFPDTNMEPGIHQITIIAEEVMDDGKGMVNANVAVVPVILLKALFPGKKIGAELEFPKEVRIDKKAGVNVIIDGWGKGLIDDLNADIEIYDSFGRVIDTIVFDSVSLEPGDKHTFSKEWSPRDAGIILTKDSEDFKAVAIVTYDGELETAERAFEVTTDLMVIKEKSGYNAFLVIIAVLTTALLGAFVYILRVKRR